MAGDLRRLRGERDKKSVPHCIVHACMNGLFFLTTELHCSFSSYITFASLLHHSFSSYVTFTSVPSSVPFVHPTPFLNVLKTVFPAVPATPHGHAINSFPFTVFGWEECRKQDLPRLSCVNFRAMHLRAYSCMP
jgi:hypothetical protein